MKPLAMKVIEQQLVSLLSGQIQIIIHGNGNAHIKTSEGFAEVATMDLLTALENVLPYLKHALGIVISRGGDVRWGSVQINKDLSHKNTSTTEKTQAIKVSPTDNAMDGSLRNEVAGVSIEPGFSID